MVSAIDRAKRLLVCLLKSSATTYGVVLQLSRDAADADVTSAFRKVSRKAHPDQGGKVADQTALSNARDAWQDAVKGKCFAELSTQVLYLLPAGATTSASAPLPCCHRVQEKVLKTSS